MKSIAKYPVDIQRKITPKDIKAIIRALKKLPKLNTAAASVMIGIASGCKKESIAYARQIRDELKKAGYLAHTDPLVYFIQWEEVEKNYEVMKEQPYNSACIRVYDRR